MCDPGSNTFCLGSRRSWVQIPPTLLEDIVAQSVEQTIKDGHGNVWPQQQSYVLSLVQVRSISSS